MWSGRNLAQVRSEDLQRQRSGLSAVSASAKEIAAGDSEFQPAVRGSRPGEGAAIRDVECSSPGLKIAITTFFNPLQLPETPANFEFLKTWLRALVHAAEALSAREEADLDHTLRGTLALEVSHRRLSSLIEFRDSTRAEGIHAHLSRWCESTG